MHEHPHNAHVSADKEANIKAKQNEEALSGDHAHATDAMVSKCGSKGCLLGVLDRAAYLVCLTVPSRQGCLQGCQQGH